MPWPGKQNFGRICCGSFRMRQQAIDRYMELLSKSVVVCRHIAMERVLKPWQHKLAAPFMNLKKPKDLYRNTYDVLSELTDDQDLIATICGQWGDMGLPPKRSAFMVHAMIARHYLYGGYYPVGGSWKIADSIIPQIQKPGGEVFTYARVEQILVENGKVTGVEMADGHRIDCGCVISSAGVANTFEGLVDAATVTKFGYAKQLPKCKAQFRTPGCLRWPAAHC